jgi:hypothetical protein
MGCENDGKFKEETVVNTGYNVVDSYSFPSYFDNDLHVRALGR